jgi:hypothetical protein
MPENDNREEIEMRLKKKPSPWKRNIALLLSLAFVAQFALTMPLVVRADGSGVDKTGLYYSGTILKDEMAGVTVTQDGVPVADLNNLDPTKEFTITLNLKNIPVQNDPLTGGEFIETGDKVVFILADGLEFAGIATNQDMLLKGMSADGIPDGKYRLGVVSFTKDSGKLFATVDFDCEKAGGGEADPDDDVFDDPDFADVSGEFSITMKHEKAGPPAGDGLSYTITILGKEYMVKYPATYTVEKSVVNPRSVKNDTTYDIQSSVEAGSNEVEWQVVLDGNPVSLKDYTFSDALDPNTIGTYVANSFQLEYTDADGGKVTPVVTDEQVFDNDALSYTFTEGMNAPVTIKFKTTIPDDKYFKNDNNLQSMKNTAKLAKDSKSYSGEATATFTPQWIDKVASVQNAWDAETGELTPTTGRTLTWTVDVNQKDVKMDNVTIVEELPYGLDYSGDPFVSVVLKKSDGTDVTPVGTWYTLTTAHDDDAKKGAIYTFTLGNITEHLQLELVTKLPDITPGAPSMDR